MTRVPFTQMLQAIPGFFGIRLEEEPKFEVVETVGNVEIRRYQPAVLAQVTVPGDHDRAVDAAFEKLAGYIYGGNRSGEHMDMTTPVLQQARGSEQSSTAAPVLQSASGEGWMVAFFLSNDLTPEEAPVPNDPSIELVQGPEMVIGTLRYSGNNTAERRAAAKQELLETLVGHPRWRVAEDVAWAQYDQPFAIPFLKRNEAHVALAPI